jgi:hypothetical protein
MNTSTSAPRPREILSTCQAIRSHWSNAKLRARQRLARTKQRQLARWLTGGHSCRSAV